MITRSIILVSVLLLPIMSQAQQPDTVGAQHLPLLQYLVRAKLDSRGAQPKLIVMVGSLRRNEPALLPQKLRNLPGVVGDLERREGDSREARIDARGNVIIPTGRKPITLEVSDVKFYGLDGTQLSLAKAHEMLAILRPVFFFDRFAGDVVPLPADYKQRLGEFCLIVVTPRQVRPAE